jgi:cytoskeleton protein RodZ
MSTESLNTPNLSITLPGAALKQAREAKGLTVEEMAAISNLTKQVIRGIESDSYDELAGLSFVRGYLKLYSKKLGVDEASILEPFDEWKRARSGEGGTIPHLKGFENHPADSESNAGSRNVMWLGAGVLVVLLATGTYISLQENATTVTVEGEPAVVSPSVADSPILPSGEATMDRPELPSEISDVENTITESAQVSDEAVAESEEGSSEQAEATEVSGDLSNPVIDTQATTLAAESDVPVAEDPPPAAAALPPVEEAVVAPTPAAVEPIVGTPRPPPPAAGVTPPVQNVTLPDPPAVAAPVVDPTTPARVPRAGRVVAEAQDLLPPIVTPREDRSDNRDQDAGLRVLSETVTGAVREREQLGAPGRLQMRFTGESWVEVRDAQGRLILADLMRADRDVSLDTWGPIEVLVGAVDASVIVFNGETLDLSNRAFQNVARVTLGAVRN